MKKIEKIIDAYFKFAVITIVLLFLTVFLMYSLMYEPTILRDWATVSKYLTVVNACGISIIILMMPILLVVIAIYANLIKFK